MESEHVAHGDFTSGVNAPSDGLVRDLLEQVEDAVYIHDLEGRFVEANRRACNLLGYSRERLTQLRLQDVASHGPSDGDLSFRCVDLDRDAPATFESVHRRSDGSVFPVEISLKPMSVGNERLVMVLVRDLSDSRRAEEKLRRSETWWRELLDQANSIILRLDSKGRISYFNNFAERFFGYNREEVIGRSVVGTIVPKTDSAGRDLEVMIANIVENAECYARNENENVTRDGRRVWVAWTNKPVLDDQGRFQEVLCIGNDVTALKRAEESLRKHELIMTKVERLGKVGGWEWDISNSRVFVSPEWRRIHGVSKAMLLEADLMPIAHPEDAARVRAAMRRSATEGVSYSLIHRVIRQVDGLERTVRALGEVAERDSEGRPSKMYGVVQDITEEVQEQDRRVALVERLQQTQKLESLATLAGGVAHHFNNLLHSILGYADMALLEVPPEVPGRDSIMMIQEVTKRAAALSLQMLACSGQGGMSLDKIDLSALVRGMNDVLRVHTSGQVALRVNLVDRPPRITADAGQLRQMIGNLVLNAVEACQGREGGLVFLCTRHRQCDQAFLAETYMGMDLTPGEYVVIEVTDNGCGMDPETQARVFDPFFSTKFTGRGLGMAAVLGIVRGHDGAIRIVSEPGRGTSVLVLFPATEPACEEVPVPKVPDEWRGQGTVLLVDDEEIVLATGSFMLEHLGFRVALAKNGREALEMFETREGDFVCVILDLIMPGMDGDTVYAELRRLAPDLPVIISTGNSHAETAARFSGSNVRVVTKPHSVDQLAEALRDLLGV